MQMAERRQRIYPTGTYFIGGVPAQEMLVEPDVADELTAGAHPAFTRSRPKDQPEPSPTYLEGPAVEGLTEATETPSV